MSKFFGPPTGPVALLLNDNDPLCTVVRSAPSLIAKTGLSVSGPNNVVDNSMVTLLSVELNAPPPAPLLPSGRNFIAVIITGDDPNSDAAYTCSYRIEAIPKKP